MSGTERGRPQISEVFLLIGKLGAALGVRNINELPGCWEYAIDERWSISVNGHRETIKSSTGMDVAPFHCYVEFNGWPAGYLGPEGGRFAAGAAANEEEFLDAIHRAITKAGTQ